MTETGTAAIRGSAAMICALICAAPMGALAQGAPVSAGADGDVVVVTGAARRVAREKLGASLTVLHGEQIALAGYDYLSDALRTVPGLAVSRTGGFGALTQVRIRGAEGNHTLVLLNGVDVSPAGQGETDLSTLMAGNVARIEVLRGPQSGLYGSNALAGVVNVITRRVADGSFYDLSAEAGSFETYRLDAAAGYGNGRAYVSGSANWLETAGFDASDGGAPGQIWDNDAEGNEALTLFLAGGAALSDAFRIDGFVRHVGKSSETDGFDFSGVPGVQGHAVDDPSAVDTDDFTAAGSATLTLLDGASVTVASLSHTESESDAGYYGDEASRTRAALQSSISFGPESAASTLTGFAELKDETYRNTYPFDPSQIPEQSRELFGIGLEYRLEIARQLYLSGAVRHDDNDAFEDAQTFGAAASWVIPESGFRLHASAGTGVTNPTFNEQFGYTPGTFTGNPDLTPEEAWGWDAGVEAEFAGGRAVLDVTYFRATLEDEIVSCFPSVCNDAGKSDRQGIEISGRFSPARNIDLIGSYSYVDATDPIGTREVRRPEHMASLDASWRFLADRAALTLGVAHNGEQLDDDFRGGFVPVKTALDAYTLVRLSGRYRVTDRVELFGRVENLFNTDYAELLTYNTPGRAIYLGVRVAGGSAGRQGR